MDALAATIFASTSPRRPTLDTTMPALPAYIGIVKEIIPSYVDKTIGYNLTLEEDPRPGRLWFFLQHQLTPA